MSSRVGGLLLALCMCVGASASAQETINTGAISGRVTDPQGAVVPGATVVARQIETNVRMEATTDQQSGTVSLSVPEGFNVTSRTNVVSVNGNFGAGPYPTDPARNFGAATAVGEPRTVQLGVRLRW